MTPQSAFTIVGDLLGDARPQSKPSFISTASSTWESYIRCQWYILGTENMGFDRTHLPPVDFEFVVVGDTHYMVEGVDEVEFESRRRQTARITHALEQIRSLDPDFVVHLGDMVQKFPESTSFESAVTAANEQFEGIGADLYHVAGNHDVGDKPDPTMPTEWVTPESLRSFHERYGPSWYSWDHDGVHFVVLNSQIMNSSLPVSDKQQEWLEADLAETADEPVFVFLHLPPFLHEPDEPALGHYDNIDRPARDWLLQLVREHGVTDLFAGHSHFRFHNRVGDVRCHVAPSPSFTRPGFGELFSSYPPPEQGRDDCPKLGFFLVRMTDGKPNVHFVRTAGNTSTTSAEDRSKLLTRTSSPSSNSRLGVSLIHPLTETTEIPATFPSAIRQRVHNDYPFFGCLETGFGFVRTPMEVQADKVSRQKLRSLRRSGVTVIRTTLSRGSLASPAVSAARQDLLDELELRVAGGPLPTAETVKRVATCQETLDGSINLSTVAPGRTVAEKQHSRLRSGYLPSELEGVNEGLAEYDCRVDRVLCRVSGDEDPWTTMCEGPDVEALSGIRSVDWLVASTDVDANQLTDRLARAIFAIASKPGSRLHLEPLRALDRTMDLAPGLLDRRCNPTPTFDAVRCLNTVLSGGEWTWNRYPKRVRESGTLIALHSGKTELVLALPNDRNTSFTVDLSEEARLSNYSSAVTISLERGTTRSVGSAGGSADTADISIEEPTLFALEN